MGNRSCTRSVSPAVPLGSIPEGLAEQAHQAKLASWQLAVAAEAAAVVRIDLGHQEPLPLLFLARLKAESGLE